MISPSMSGSMRKARQLVVLSGKGGTGKTSVTAALAHLAAQGTLRIGAAMVDADVDAANLAIVLQPDRAVRHEFVGGSLAVIDEGRCAGCGACVEVCRYDAILENGPVYAVDPMACDGCAACVYACPEGAIRMEQQVEGEWFASGSAYGPIHHAELYPGRENSGKLVTLIKQNARLFAHESGLPLIIIDGPPGIGCPAISACAGADLALLVAEPGQSGQHDLLRALEMLRHFKVPAVVVINKADLYPEGTLAIRRFAAEQQMQVLGEIGFDRAVVDAMVAGQPVTLHSPYSPAARSLTAIWESLSNRLMEGASA